MESRSGSWSARTQQSSTLGWKEESVFVEVEEAGQRAGVGVPSSSGMRVDGLSAVRLDPSMGWNAIGDRFVSGRRREGGAVGRAVKESS